MTLNLNVNHVGLDCVVRLLAELLQTGDQLMTALDNLAAQVRQNTQAEASAIELLRRLSELLAQAAGDPAAIEALATELRTSADALAQAILENTPQPV